MQALVVTGNIKNEKEISENMKITNYVFLCLIVLNQSCIRQTTPQKSIYSKDFNWTITIPENFESLTAEQWKKMQNKGTEAIEKTYHKKVVNQAKTIFVFQNDKFNYLQSDYRIFDILRDEDYSKTFKTEGELLYQTCNAQIPGTKIDTTYSTEKIDNLEFKKFKLTVTFPNKGVLNLFMFRRLFGNKEFTLNLFFKDELKGEKMLECWRKSKFSNTKNPNI